MELWSEVLSSNVMFRQSIVGICNGIEMSRKCGNALEQSSLVVFSEGKVKIIGNAKWKVVANFAISML